MFNTVQMLRKTIKKLNMENVIQVIDSAVSNIQGRKRFPNMDVGIESIGLEVEFHHDKNFTDVNIVTLDQIVESLQTKKIDLLSIDAEGYDYLVFEGGHNTFLSVYVRFLEFEYHSVSPWPKYSLHNLIRYLDVMTFDCYWQGNQGQLWRLTGCFHENYKVRATWSNVMCVNRREEKAAALLYSIAQSYEKWGVD
jgi:FkbM family methyltransferase